VRRCRGAGRRFWDGVAHQLEFVDGGFADGREGRRIETGYGEPGEDEVVSCGGILAVDVGESRGAIGSGDGLGVSVAGEA
jgi:hypothetical protein